MPLNVSCVSVRLVHSIVGVMISCPHAFRHNSVSCFIHGILTLYFKWMWNGHLYDYIYLWCRIYIATYYVESTWLNPYDLLCDIYLSQTSHLLFSACFSPKPLSPDCFQAHRNFFLENMAIKWSKKALGCSSSKCALHLRLQKLQYISVRLDMQSHRTHLFVQLCLRMNTSGLWRRWWPYLYSEGKSSWNNTLLSVASLPLCACLR